MFAEAAKGVERGALDVHAQEVDAADVLRGEVNVEADRFHFGDGLLVAAVVVVARAEAGRRAGVVDFGAVGGGGGADDGVKRDAGFGVPNGFFDQANAGGGGVGADAFAGEREHVRVALEGVDVGVEFFRERDGVATIVRAEFEDGANGRRVDQSEQARVEVVALAPVAREGFHAD